MRLALCLVVAVAGCAADVTPGAPSAVAPGLKRVTQDVQATPSGHRRVLRDRTSRNHQRAPLHDWSGVAQCESGSDWRINTGNGYFGGLQMDMTFWSNYGGLAFAARPDLATELEQITVAERGLAVQGADAWPVCGRYLRTAS